MTSLNKKYCKSTFKRVHLSASMTIEAAVIIPLVVFVMYIFVYILMLLNFQVKVSEALYNTARTNAQYSNVYDAAELIDKLASHAMIVNEIGKDNIEQMGIIGGSLGMHCIFSDFDDGNVDILVNYTLKLPILGNFYVNCTQRAKTRAFIGRAVEKDGENQEYVYITPTGKVYHSSINCTYLKLSIKEVDKKELENKKNLNDESYTECELCGKSAAYTDSVYITDYGNRFHTNRNCSGIKRGIIKITKEQSLQYRACSKCGEKIE